MGLQKNIPNLLTALRVAVIPFILISFYLPFVWAHWIAVSLFITACITDFLDGYLARRWDLTSSFGRVLDPVADKLLVCSTLLMLTGTGVIRGPSLLAAVVILFREILVSGLREFLAGLSLETPSSWPAKCKTAIQMAALFCLLIQDTAFLFPTWLWHNVGLFCLWIAAALTLYTGYDYVREAYARLAPFWHKKL